jgi:hypothetical protein
MPLPPSTPIDPPTARRGGIPVWLPWVLSPGFLLLPIGGCGVAAALRQPARVASLAPADAPGIASAPPVVPVTAVARVVSVAR